MKVALVTSWLSRSGGGVSTAVEALSRSLLPICDTHVIGLRDDAWQTDGEAWSGAPATALPVRGPAAIGYAPEMSEHLRALDPDVAHTHGLWMHPSRDVARWSKRTGRPYIVSPHGMLDSWAIRQSHWKKRVAGWLYENAHLHRANCLHALCEAEARAIRELGFDNPICVIPNGVSPPAAGDEHPAPWHGRIPEQADVMLFLGRLHPKKNLPALIEDWPAKPRGNWHLAIAGWDQLEHESDLRELVKKRGLEDRVHFLGPLFGSSKDAALRNARAFVLPSLSEGLPMAVLEAWSYALPVLMTDACNLPQGFEAGAAARLSLAKEEMQRDLQLFMRQDAETLKQMGQNGRELAQKEFSWSAVAAQLLDVYAWLGGNGKEPATIHKQTRLDP
jgi:poly(glycerol-phosphate) alpha-glucosyltransferase